MKGLLTSIKKRGFYSIAESELIAKEELLKLLSRQVYRSNGSCKKKKEVRGLCVKSR